MNSSQFKDIISSKKYRYICTGFFIILFISFIVIPISAAAEIDYNSILNGYNEQYNIPYNVGKMLKVRNGWSNMFRTAEYNILLLLAKIIDMFGKAIDDLVDINLYDLIKNSFNIESVVYPVAWAAAGLALIIAAIMLLIKVDKMHISDFFRNLLVGLMILIGLPTLISSLSDLRRQGKDDANSVGANEMSYTSEGTVIGQETLGAAILSRHIYYIPTSIDNSDPCTINRTTAYKNDYTMVYQLGINDTCDPSQYPFKVAYLTPPELVQTPYSDLSFFDKLKLLDGKFLTNYGTPPDSISHLFETWENMDERYLSVSGSNIYVKSGGGISNKKKVWIRYQPMSSSDSHFFMPWTQILEGDTVYKDGDENQPIPYLAEAESYESGGYWKYHGEYAYNYQRILIDKLVEYVSSRKLPAPFIAVLQNESWIYNNLRRAASFEDAIKNIERTKVYCDDVDGEFSLLEYLNISENYKAYKANDMTDGSTYVLPLEDYSDYGTFDKLWKNVETFGYLEERLYAYHMNFGYALITLIITLICLVFAGFKLASLLFDVLFAQIVAPLIVATDLQGAGRAKQVVMNLISCNICFLVVLLTLRLYILVVTAAQTEFSFLVAMFITLAGCKFVIDGPDLVVKILGIDAGVKSGAAVLMGIRSATQMTSSVVRTGKNIATAPARMAGRASAAVSDVKGADGAGGKAMAVLGNTSMGQSYRQAANSQNSTNSAYHFHSTSSNNSGAENNNYSGNSSNTSSNTQNTTNSGSNGTPSNNSSTINNSSSDNNYNVSSTSTNAAENKNNGNTPSNNNAFAPVSGQKNEHQNQSGNADNMSFGSNGAYVFVEHNNERETKEREVNNNNTTTHERTETATKEREINNNTTATNNNPAAAPSSAAYNGNAFAPSTPTVINGRDGRDGRNGVDGVNGAQGVQGTKGEKGDSTEKNMSDAPTWRNDE